MKKILWLGGKEITEDHMRLLMCSDLQYIGRTAYYVAAQSHEHASLYPNYQSSDENCARDRYNYRVSQDKYEEISARRKVIGGI